MHEVHLIGHEDEIECFDAPEDGSALIATAALDRTVRVWDTATGDCVHTFAGMPAGTSRRGMVATPITVTAKNNGYWIG